MRVQYVREAKMRVSKGVKVAVLLGAVLFVFFGLVYFLFQPGVDCFQCLDTPNPTTYSRVRAALSATAQELATHPDYKWQLTRTPAPTATP